MDEDIRLAQRLEARSDKREMNSVGSRIRITELVLRDGHQSMIATRMRTEDMLPIIEKMDEVGYYSLEMWGGATFDVCLRFLDEDPWERLRALRKKVKHTKLQMLLRGQNLVGYRHYPDDVVVKFVETAARNGIDIFRVFDALNDIRNMEVSIRTAKRCGCIVEGALSYTVSPVHTVEKYVALAKELAALGSDIICVKDMAGLLTPMMASRLTEALRREVGLPIHIHSHTTGGLAHMSLFAACEAGASLLDTVISPFSQGSSHPPTESIVAALRGTPYDTGLDLRLLVEIAAHFQSVKEKYKSILDPIAERVDTNVLVHQIPGGMLSNLVSQLKEQNALDRYDEVLKEVPMVRAELGYPPLVTPTSQIVGTQAVFNIILGSRYKLISKEVKDYIKGLYGRPPAPIDENVKKLAIGDEPVIEVRPAELLQPGFEKARSECGELCSSVEDVLSYALFPQVALEFFKRRKNGRPAGAKMALDAAKKKKIAILSTDGDRFVTQVGDRRYEVRAERTGSSMILSIGNNVYEADMSTMPMPTRTEVAQERELIQPDKVRPSTGRPSELEEGAVVAPMPGKVVLIKVKEGDAVEEGAHLVTLEAMKMQNEISAPRKGRIRKILVSIGDAVNSQDVMLIIE